MSVQLAHRSWGFLLSGIALDMSLGQDAATEEKRKANGANFISLSANQLRGVVSFSLFEAVLRAFHKHSWALSAGDQSSVCEQLSCPLLIAMSSVLLFEFLIVCFFFDAFKV